MSHDEVITRLRRLADQHVDVDVAAAHRDRIAAAAAGGAGHRRVALTAAACLAALALPAAGLVVARTGGGDPDPAGVVDRPVFPVERLACTGPPPFAGPSPAGNSGVLRAAEAREFAEWRIANCPP